MANTTRIRTLDARKNFGCYGNGTTEDSTKLLTAITTCLTQRYDLFIPNGQYKLSNQLLMTNSDNLRKSGIHIYGSGVEDTVFLDYISASTTPLIKIVGAPDNSAIWNNSGFTPTFVNGTTFTVTGNQTSTLIQHLNLRITIGSGFVFCFISSSTFGSGITTVVITYSNTPWGGATTYTTIALDNTISVISIHPILSTTYFWGGGFHDLQIDCTHSTDTTHDVFSILGWQNGTLENIRIQKNSRHAIAQYIHLLTDPNPVNTSSVMDLKNLSLERCGGFGVYQGGYTGAPNWSFNRVNTLLNAQGSFFINSNDNTINNCTLLGSGFINETTPYSGTAYGIQLGSALSTLNNLTLNQCILDASLTAHISIDNWQGLKAQDNLFVHNDRYGAGHMVAPNGIIFASLGSSSIVKDVLFERSIFRVDPVVVGDSPNTVNCFNWNAVTNVSNIQVKSTTVIDNSGGATITKYAGYNASNMNLRQNYVIEETLEKISAGLPKDYYLGQATVANISTSGATIVYGSQDTLNNQIFSALLYNTTTGIFTVRHPGNYKIRATITLEGALTTEYNQFRFYKNGNSGTILTEFGGIGNSNTRTWFREEIIANLAIGDTINVWGTNNNGGTRAITPGDSQLLIEHLS